MSFVKKYVGGRRRKTGAEPGSALLSGWLTDSLGTSPLLMSEKPTEREKVRDCELMMGMYESFYLLEWQRKRETGFCLVSWMS